MATLKDIRKRITSVKNTQKITKAMKMVAAAKLRRAQQALMGSRPHADFLEASLSRLVRAADAEDLPLLQKREEIRKVHLLIFTSDRGLCGGFNGNLLRHMEHWRSHEGKEFPEIDITVIGKKGRDFYRAKKVELADTQTWEQETFSFSEAQAMAAQWQERYEAGEFDQLFLGYNHFKSAISQVPTLKTVLPVTLKESDEELSAPVAWEGDPRTLLKQLVLRHLATEFYLAVLESQASELGARMSAMDNATNNASEMIGSLTLMYNRARQAAITTELMDIVNGAEALG